MTDPLEAGIVGAQPKASKLGFDSLLEDVFGLNIRSLKTIGTLIRAPFRYFDAARDGDWLQRYTPSFRIWFGLIAIMAATRFLYAGAGDPLIMASQEQYEAVKELYPDRFKGLDSGQAAIDQVKWLFVFMPFVFMPIYAALAFVFRAFAREASYVLRVRYVFGTVIPSTAFILFAGLGFAVVNSNAWVMAISFGSIPVMLVLDVMTAYRGRLFATDRSKGFGMSFVFGILLLVCYFLATMLASIPAQQIAIAQNMTA